MVWDKMIEVNKGKVLPGKCRECKKSQAKKEAEKRVAEAEARGREDTVADEDVTVVHDPVPAPTSDWCCMHWVLSLQDDFANEKPMIQHYVESCRHVCIFLPKFHCKLNLIEMVWGFTKYRKCCEIDLLALADILTGYRNLSDGTFTTAK